MRHIGIALVACGLAGCFDLDDTRIAPHLVDAVQVSRSEPGPACRALGALDGTAGECDGSRYAAAYSALRTHAALLGGNYVVIDAVTSDGSDHSVTINGRVYACAFGPFATDSR
jgi:hypothetical protein